MSLFDPLYNLFRVHTHKWKVRDTYNTTNKDFITKEERRTAIMYVMECETCGTLKNHVLSVG